MCGGGGGEGEYVLAHDYVNYLIVLECHFLPIPPLAPTTESNLVTIVVSAIVSIILTAGLMAIIVPLVWTALLCYKWRMKSTASVGGTQDRGKSYH